jgi:hypothetical protein
MKTNIMLVLPVQAFVGSLKTSISREDAQLHMSQMIVYRILQKSLLLPPYILQVVLKLTACDKLLRLQSATHM